MKIFAKNYLEKIIEDVDDENKENILAGKKRLVLDVLQRLPFLLM